MFAPYTRIKKNIIKVEKVPRLPSETEITRRQFFLQKIAKMNMSMVKIFVQRNF